MTAGESPALARRTDLRLAIGTGGIGQLVAVAVQLEHDAKGVFDIDHAIGFIIGEVFAHRHPLLATCRDNLGQQVFEVGILNGDCLLYTSDAADE